MRLLGERLNREVRFQRVAHGNHKGLAARDVAHKPLVVDVLDFARAEQAGKRAVDDQAHGRIVARQHQGIGVERQEPADDFVRSRVLGFRDQAEQQDVVGGISVDTVGFQRQKSLGVILHTQDLDVLDAELFDAFLDRAFVGGALRQSDRLSGQIFDFLDPGALFGEDFGAGDEGRVGVVDLLLTGQVVGGRAAFDVDVAVCDERNAGLRRDRNELDIEFHAEFRLNGFHGLHAQIHGIADRLAFRAYVGEGHRRFAVTEDDRAGFLDFGQRAVKVGSIGVRGGEYGRGRAENHKLLEHSDTPFCLVAPEGIAH